MTTDSPERVSDERVIELIHGYEHRPEMLRILRELLASRAEVEKLRVLVELAKEKCFWCFGVGYVYDAQEDRRDCWHCAPYRAAMTVRE